MKEDVTRLAVVAASKKIKAATDKLKLILYTGPDQVLMTPGEIQKKISEGNEKLLPYAMSGDSSADNELLDTMLADAQIRRRNGTSRS
jgi:hypothetical protein